MNAQNCIELVYTILHSITYYTKGVPKTMKKNEYKIYQNYDFENKHPQHIEALVISNPEKLQLYKRNLEVGKSRMNRIRRSFISNPYPRNEEFGNFQEIIIDRDITCIEFAPDVFAHLRIQDGFDNAALRKSMDPQIEANIERIFKAGEGMGKSGSFFFFSHDTQFLIKTMTSSDFNAFSRMFR